MVARPDIWLGAECDIPPDPGLKRYPIVYPDSDIRCSGLDTRPILNTVVFIMQNTMWGWGVKVQGKRRKLHQIRSNMALN